MRRIILTRANVILHNLQQEVAALYALVLEDYAYPYRSRKVRKGKSHSRLERKPVTQRQQRFRKKIQSTDSSNGHSISGSSYSSKLNSLHGSAAAEPSTQAGVIVTDKSKTSSTGRSDVQSLPPRLRRRMINYRRSQAWQRQVTHKFERLNSRYNRKRHILESVGRDRGSKQGNEFDILKHFQPEDEAQQRLVESCRNLAEIMEDYRQKVTGAKDGLSIAGKMVADVVFELYGQTIPSVEAFVERTSLDGLSSDGDDNELNAPGGHLTQGQAAAQRESDPEAEAKRRHDEAADRRVRAKWDLQYTDAEFDKYWFSYDAKLADWKFLHQGEKGDSQLTEFQVDFLLKGQSMTKKVRQAEEEYSAAATEARKLHAWAWNASCSDQSSRFHSDESIDEEELRQEEEHAKEKTNLSMIRSWQKSIEGDPTLPESRKLADELADLKAVVIGETPFEFVDGRQRRHISKWNDRRLRLWREMTENWQDRTYDREHDAEVVGPPIARPDSPPRSAERTDSTDDCGIEVTGRSLRYSTRQERRDAQVRARCSPCI